MKKAELLMKQIFRWAGMPLRAAVVLLGVIPMVLLGLFSPEDNMFMDLKEAWVTWVWLGKTEGL